MKVTDAMAHKGHIRHTRQMRIRRELHSKIKPRRRWPLLIAALLIAIAAVLLLTSCMPPQPQHSSLPVRGIAELPTYAAPTNTELPELATATAFPTRTPLPLCVVATGINGGTVNIRSGPGMQYPVVDYASEGEVLVIAGAASGGWLEVCNDKLVEGYFYERWCAK